LDNSVTLFTEPEPAGVEPETQQEAENVEEPDDVDGEQNFESELESRIAEAKAEFEEKLRLQQEVMMGKLEALKEELRTK